MDCCGTNLGIGLAAGETTLTTLTLRPSLGPLRFFPVQSFIGPVAEGREGVCAGKSTLKSQRRRTLWRTNGGRISPAIVSLQYPSQNPLPCLSALLRIPLIRPRHAGVRLSPAQANSNSFIRSYGHTRPCQSSLILRNLPFLPYGRAIAFIGPLALSL